MSDTQKVGISGPNHPTFKEVMEAAAQRAAKDGQPTYAAPLYAAPLPTPDINKTLHPEKLDI